MTFGPGKYDHLTTLVRKRAGVTEGGGVVLIVVGGDKGPGFSVQADFETSLMLPDILEMVAKQMRRDVVG